MTPRIAALLSITLLGAALSLSPAAAADCASGQSRPSLDMNSVTPGAVDDGQVATYKFTVPAGQTAYLAVQMSHGDIDVRVCQGSDLVCESTNTVMIHDGCHASEASVELPSPPWNPGTYLAEWGNSFGPGNYKLDINHCFSSKDSDVPDGEYDPCDYAAQDPVLGDEFAPGALDPVPAIQFAIVLAAN